MSGKPTARSASRAKAATPAPTTTTARTTRARTATTKATTASSEVSTTVQKRTNVRKPLASKDNSIDSPATGVRAKAKPASSKKGATLKSAAAADSDREPIMAYLRIRPHLGDEESAKVPYLTPLSDTTVNMADPQDSNNSRNKYRFSTVSPSSLYTFSHVFPPNTKQQDFFIKTTLPLVQDVLLGQNGLLFTYGVTNSGKTYTVQGGNGQGHAGILPRSLDVIFNSVEGLHGDGRYRPVRLHGVEYSYDQDLKVPVPEPALVDVLGSLDNHTEVDFDIDSTVIQVDRNYEYSIWISYAEVYNEKIYDLLASVKDEPTTQTENTNSRPAATKSLLLTRQALPLRPSPPSDNIDAEYSGKYIAGLRQFRVTTAAQAKAIIKLGQLHRRVFGTLANRESSRSHGMVIIKVVRGHRGERDDPTSLQISRLTLVDLAGSERTKHTHTTGERLKEAGNINKSLMVLGQCMEVMRSNQRKLAISLSQESSQAGRVDTRDVKKALALVPFRHSKLTEALMDYFVGDGRTVMIVNVNPYDTGYDENSHVMKFAALAREVTITPAPAPVQRVPVVGPGSLQGKKIRQLGPLTLKDPDIVPRPYTRKVTISMGGFDTGRQPVEAILEVREDEEQMFEPEKDSEIDDDYPINPLVDALFDEIEHLRMQLFESEMKCALIEAETREEVMREMEERMRSMESMYSRRLMRELERQEMKTDAKIDMLHQSGLFGSPIKAGRRPVIVENLSEDDVERSLILEDEQESEGYNSMPSSPLTRNPPVDTSSFPSDIRAAARTDNKISDDMSQSDAAGSGNGDELQDSDEDEHMEHESEAEGGNSDEDTWEPELPSVKARAEIPKTTRQGQGKETKSKSKAVEMKSTTSTSEGTDTKARVISQLAGDMENLDMNDEDSDDSIAVVTKTKKAKGRSQSSTAHDMIDEAANTNPPVVKKKKRIIGKNQIITEEDIEKAAWEVERKAAKMQGGGYKSRPS